jgi:hypothetical protein
MSPNDDKNLRSVALVFAITVVLSGMALMGNGWPKLHVQQQEQKASERR